VFGSLRTVGVEARHPEAFRYLPVAGPPASISSAAAQPHRFPADPLIRSQPAAIGVPRGAAAFSLITEIEFSRPFPLAFGNFHSLLEIGVRGAGMRSVGAGEDVIRTTELWSWGRGFETPSLTPVLAPGPPPGTQLQDGKLAPPGSTHSPSGPQ
jgi:hypothetical protein